MISYRLLDDIIPPCRMRSGRPGYMPTLWHNVERITPGTHLLPQSQSAGVFSRDDTRWVSTALLGLPTRLPNAYTDKSKEESILSMNTFTIAGGSDGPRSPHDLLQDDCQPPSLDLADAYLPSGVPLSGLREFHISSTHHVSRHRPRTLLEPLACDDIPRMATSLQRLLSGKYIVGALAHTQ
jgi:hypothetical protein